MSEIVDTRDEIEEVGDQAKLEQALSLGEQNYANTKAYRDRAKRVIAESLTPAQRNWGDRESLMQRLNSSSARSTSRPFSCRVMLVRRVPKTKLCTRSRSDANACRKCSSIRE